MLTDGEAQLMAALRDFADAPKIPLHNGKRCVLTVLTIRNKDVVKHFHQDTAVDTQTYNKVLEVYDVITHYDHNMVQTNIYHYTVKPLLNATCI
jgi:hypothetical protein